MRRAKRWFGDFLKPEKPEHPQEKKEQEEKPQKEGGMGLPLGWLLFAVAAIVCVVFLFLWVMRGKEVELAVGRVNALADVAGALLEGDFAGLRESLGRARALEMPPNVENVLAKIDAETKSEATLWRRFLAVAKQHMSKNALKKALFAEIEEALKEQVEKADARALKRLLGEEKAKALFALMVKEAEAIDLKASLGGRLDTLIRMRFAELAPEKAAAVMGPAFLPIFAHFAKNAASNYPALLELFGDESLETLASTLIANLKPERLAPALEERIEKLTEAVREWRARNSVIIFLKDGSTLEGTLLKKTEDQILIRKPDGNKQAIPIKDVKEIKRKGD